jgi:glycosyltransferase involved in cell wall biosynthesis
MRPRTLPKLSIIIPSYNQRDFLANALNSLARQDYPNLEVILVDGASTDGTVELLKRRGDIITRWLSEPDRGQTHALNKGFRLATGEIFGWLNSDERYRPGTLQLVGKTFAADPALDIVFGHRIVIDQQGRELRRMKLPLIHPRNYALYASGLLYSDTTFWKADLHRRTGEFDETNCQRYAMDFDWFGRLGLKVNYWKRLDAYLSEFTEHENRISQNVVEMREISREIRRRLQKLAGVKPSEVLLFGLWYLILSRYGSFGWQGLLRPPKPASLLRVAGLIR